MPSVKDIYQAIAEQFHDGTIIACSPVVHTEGIEPARIVIRRQSGQFVVHMQVWQYSELRTGQRYDLTKVFYSNGDYFPTSESGALGRAWDRFYERFGLLCGREDLYKTLAKRDNNRSKAILRTEITTLQQPEQQCTTTT
jgi:hypothetical protein